MNISVVLWRRQRYDCGSTVFGPIQSGVGVADSGSRREKTSEKGQGINESYIPLCRSYIAATILYVGLTTRFLREAVSTGTIWGVHNCVVYVIDGL